jgi:hypothetical protein
MKEEGREKVQPARDKIQGTRDNKPDARDKAQAGKREAEKKTEPVNDFLSKLAELKKKFK